jgi:Transglutaminase-like superfamily
VLVRPVGRLIDRRTLAWRARELTTTAHVGLVLALVELLIRFVPLPRLCRLMGVELNLASSIATPPEPISPRELPPRARRQLRCTRRVTDAWPLSRGPCLRRSLVAGHLLRNRRPTIRLGTVDVGESFVAHAWLEIDGRPLERVEEYRPFERRGTAVGA